VGSLITEGETGLLCTLDPNSLAQQTIRLYHDPALHQRIAEQARALALVRHNPDTILERTLAAYRAVVAQPAGQRAATPVPVLAAE
jgi:glycosyltransferase involved in cell wall biosynthesis